MTPDAARFISAAVIVICFAVLVILAATRCRDFEAYVAVSLLAVLAGFIALTQDA